MVWRERVIVRWLDGALASMVAIEDDIVSICPAGALWDLSVAWPVGDRWDNVHLLAVTSDDEVGAFGFKPEAKLHLDVNVEVSCRVLLVDGPAWLASAGSVDVEIDEGYIRTGQHRLERTPDLVMEMPWRLAVRWLADDGALLADFVGEQMAIDGDLMALSALEGARGLAALAGHEQNELVVRWNEMWEKPEIRAAVSALLDERTAWHDLGR